MSRSIHRILFGAVDNYFGWAYMGFEEDFSAGCIELASGTLTFLRTKRYRYSMIMQPALYYWEKYS